MTQTHSGDLVLGIDPFSRGFGYVVFDGNDTPIDWGLREARTNKNKQCIGKLGDLLRLYPVDTIVIENCAGTGSRRDRRIKALFGDIEKLAQKKRIDVQRYSPAQVRQFFSQFEASTKYDIAEFLAGRFVEFIPRLPPPRKPWMSEDPRMSIFDAAALALTHMGMPPKREGGFNLH